MSTPLDLLRTAARPDPGRPFVTFYDDASGERVELSFSTFDNWVAKTGNMIVEELGARPGDRFALLVPTHWQTAVWYVACWAAGVVAGPETLAAALRCPGEKVLLHLQPFGSQGATELPPGVYDYAAEVPAYPD